MGSLRVWLFRVLVLLAAGLFLVSWLIPWWRSNIQEAGLFVQIRPWGLEHNLGYYMQYMGDDPSMPAFFAPLMWLYLVLAIGALLVSMFVEGRSVRLGTFELSLPHVLIAGVGLSYIFVAVVFVIYAYMRMAALDILFVGTSYITIEHFELGAEAISDLEPGFWLACAAGPVCVVLALLRNVITGGKHKLVVRRRLAQ
jgi:hypothetical protein